MAAAGYLFFTFSLKEQNIMPGEKKRMGKRDGQNKTQGVIDRKDREDSKGDPNEKDN